MKHYLRLEMLTVTTLCAAFCFCHVCNAALIAYDDFEIYSPGANLNDGSGGTGWAGNWGATNDYATVQLKQLDDPNGNVDGGLKAVRFLPTADEANIDSFIQRAIPDTSNTLYMSMLFRKESFDDTHFLNFQVSDGDVGNVLTALGVGLRNVTDNPFFARVGDSSNGDTMSALSPSTLNTDFLIVAKFSKDGSQTYNRTDLFINPVDQNEPTTADATASSAVTGLSKLTLFSVRYYTPTTNDTVFIDELRFADTFADAVGPAVAGSSVSWSAATAVNITTSNAQAVATVNTNLDTTVLVWDTEDKGTTDTNLWTGGSISLGPKSAGSITGLVSSLSADTSYVARFFGENTDTNGWSVPITFSTAFSNAQTPAFTNADPSFVSVVLGWQDNAVNETAYILQRSTTAESGYVTITTLGQNATSYTDGGLSALTTYYYQLAATNSDNGSVTVFSDCRTSATTEEGFPDIAVYDGNDIVESGGTNNLGTISVGQAGGSTLVISNTASATGNLLLNNSPAVVFTENGGTNYNGFTIVSNVTGSATNLGVGDGTSFTIEFSGAAVGTYSVSVSIFSNDSDSNPYTFTIVADTLQPGPEQTIELDFESAPAGSTPPDGWSLAGPGNGTYETVAGTGNPGQSGNFSASTGPRYLVNDGEPLIATEAISGSFDFYVVDAGAYMNTRFFIGDIQDGLSSLAGEFLQVDLREATFGARANILDADSTTLFDGSGNNNYEISCDSWHQGSFTWTPTSGTSGNFSFSWVHPTKGAKGPMTVVGYTFSSPYIFFGFGTREDAGRFDNISITGILVAPPPAGTVIMIK